MNIPGDIHCASCRYNLRGLPPDGNCPECGYSIPATMQVRFVQVRRDDLRGIRRGLAMILIGLVASAGVLVCGVLLAELVLFIGGGHFWVALASRAGILVGFAMAAVGVFRTTLRIPAGDRVSAVIARVAAVAWVVAGASHLLVAIAQATDVYALRVAGTVSLALMSAALALHLSRVAQLAHRDVLVAQLRWAPVGVLGFTASMFVLSHVARAKGHMGPPYTPLINGVLILVLIAMVGWLAWELRWAVAADEAESAIERCAREDGA